MARPWVLHVDLDQFIAAVEMLRRPELRDRPVIVGGRGDPTERAVVSTASYLAREYGVRSGMPLRTAARRCPDAVFLPVDAAAYRAASAEVMRALRSLDAVVEVLGWDEAFLGVTTDDPAAFAERVRRTVLAATGLHCSVGIGDNKLRAKIATEFGKPQGSFQLTEANWYAVMGHRPTTALWGVGPRISARLARLGVTTVEALATADPEVLVAEFGPAMGPWFRSLGQGVGTSQVDATPRVARSHGRETTYQRNLTEPGEVADAVRALAAQVVEDIRAEARPAVRVGLKVRFAPFHTFTRIRKLPEPSYDVDAIAAAALDMLAGLDDHRPIRLLGVRAEMTDAPGRGG